MLVWHIPTRAKPLVNCVTTNRKAKGWAGAGAGEAAHPKEETRSGARSELAMLCSKIEHCQPKSRLFRVAFSGIDCG